MNLGNTVVDKFERQPPFHFIRRASAEAADDALNRGEVYFELIIPPDFSERALAARQDVAANFTLRVAEGANYTSAIISKRFGAELAHVLNEQLNRERWAAITGDPAAPTNVSVRAAIGQLRDGAQKASMKGRNMCRRGQAGSLTTGWAGRRMAAGMIDGWSRADGGCGGFTIGRHGESGGRGAGNARPVAAAGEVAGADRRQQSWRWAGRRSWRRSIDELTAGQKKLDDGAGQLRRGAAKVPLFGGRLSAGAGQLQDGIEQLGKGLTQAARRRAGICMRGPEKT